MEEAFFGVVIGATIQTVHNLILVAMKEVKLIKNLEKDLEKLKSSLMMIENILNDAESDQPTGNGMAVKQWLKKLVDVAFEADNVLDEFNYDILRHYTNIKTTKNIMKPEFPFLHRLRLGHRIKGVYKELESINREANSFGLQRRSLVQGLPAQHCRETDSYTVDPVFLGRDDDVSTTVQMIVTTERVFSVLPIVGMGGLGKTTLARKVYHHGKIRTRFGIRIWVHVSTDFDPIVVFKKILATLTAEKVEGGNREVVLKKLEQALRDKTYLLVLDDVWNKERLKWESFMNSLCGITSTMGNSIIVTTRNRDVASIVETLPTYELNGLSENSCWSINKARAFGETDVVPPEFEALGRELQEDVKVCR